GEPSPSASSGVTVTPAVAVAKFPTRSTARAITVVAPSGTPAVAICALNVCPSLSGALTVTVLSPSVKSMWSTARLSVASTARSSAVPGATTAGTDVKPTVGGLDGSTVYCSQTTVPVQATNSRSGSKYSV